MDRRRALQMIIIDDFVKDVALLERMRDTSGDFWKKGYHWWDGWWNSNEPMTLRHELIEYIWRDGCPPQLYGTQMDGFEHWVGILDKYTTIGNEPGYALNHHFDKDEGLHKETGEIITPVMGTVYYPPVNEEKCEGGYLKIYNTHEMDLTVPYELIAPKQNRLVIFDAGQLHAVTEITKGKRYAIAINLWQPKPTTEMEY
jgi:hypothetical protein